MKAAFWQPSRCARRPTRPPRRARWRRRPRWAACRRCRAAAMPRAAGAAKKSLGGPLWRCLGSQGAGEGPAQGVGKQQDQLWEDGQQAWHPSARESTEVYRVHMNKPTPLVRGSCARIGHGKPEEPAQTAQTQKSAYTLLASSTGHLCSCPGDTPTQNYAGTQLVVLAMLGSRIHEASPVSAMQAVAPSALLRLWNSRAMAAAASWHLGCKCDTWFGMQAVGRWSNAMV